MSHVATVQIEIKSLDDLESACKRLGLEFVRGQQTYHWYGHHVGDYPLPEGFTEEDLGKCDHAIRMSQAQDDEARRKYGHKPYEIGVVKRRDGKPGYVLHWDFFGRGYGLEDVVGPECKHLRQEYSHSAVVRTLRQKGMQFSEKKLANGQYQIVTR